MQVCSFCTSSQTTTPTSHHSLFYRPDALPAAQPTASKYWRHQVKYSKYDPINVTIAWAVFLSSIAMRYLGSAVAQHTHQMHPEDCWKCRPMLQSHGLTAWNRRKSVRRQCEHSLQHTYNHFTHIPTAYPSARQCLCRPPSDSIVSWHTFTSNPTYECPQQASWMLTRR